MISAARLKGLALKQGYFLFAFYACFMKNGLKTALAG
jgi:hypothetical protein